MKSHILQNAYNAGFDDAKVTKTHDGKTVLLLFLAYRPSAQRPQEGRIRISAYYPAAQQAYLMAKKFAGERKMQGIGAKLYHKNGLKRLAAKTCGVIGKNTLFYHPVFGSYVNIQGIELDADILPDEGERGPGCGNCGACIEACPTNAISEQGFVRQECIRNHTNAPEIPGRYGLHIYQIMGCERCQDCCPKNDALPPVDQPVYEFDLLEVLQEQHTKEIKKLIGTNFGTRTRILNQAMFYAVNTRYAPALPAISALRGDEHVGAAAGYAWRVLSSLL